MSKDAVLTVRLPQSLKRRLAERATRERRSVSAQAVYELERALSEEAMGPSARAALGLFEGARLPSDEDLFEVRSALFGQIGTHGA